MKRVCEHFWMCFVFALAVGAMGVIVRSWLMVIPAAICAIGGVIFYFDGPCEWRQ